ncbi:MAG: hypothetical protein U1E50_18675 [Caulobacteraceae bacterium]
MVRPPGRPALFRDEKGDSRRRTRRALSLVVALTLRLVGGRGLVRLAGLCRSQTAEVEGKNSASERRVRPANCRLLVARGAIAQGQGAPTIALTGRRGPADGHSGALALRCGCAGGVDHAR